MKVFLVTWTILGKKQIEWRCLSRLEHGKKYCNDSPTINEIELQNAIVRAVNDYYECSDELTQILKENIINSITNSNNNDLINIQKRLIELDTARNDLIRLITSDTCNEDTLDAEFAKIHDEEVQLTEKLNQLKKQCSLSADTEKQILLMSEEIDKSNLKLTSYDDIIIRKLIECVKVMSKDNVLVIFKGGYESYAEIE